MQFRAPTRLDLPSHQLIPTWGRPNSGWGSSLTAMCSAAYRAPGQLPRSCRYPDPNHGLSPQATCRADLESPCWTDVGAALRE